MASGNANTKDHWLVFGAMLCTSFHGSRQNRHYVARYQIFHDHHDVPVRDLEIDPEMELMQWSVAARDRKPDRVRDAAEYFMQRLEDQ